MIVRFGRKQWISISLILILLATSAGFAPGAYADNAGGALSSLQTADQSGNASNGGMPVQIEQDSSAGASSPSNPTGSGPSQGVVNKVVYYQAAPSDFTLSGDKTPQPGGLHMTHVINMPQETRPAPACLHQQSRGKPGGGTERLRERLRLGGCGSKRP